MSIDKPVIESWFIGETRKFFDWKKLAFIDRYTKFLSIFKGKNKQFSEEKGFILRDAEKGSIVIAISDLLCEWA